MTDEKTTLDTAQIRRVANVPRTTDLARRLMHEAADEIDSLRGSAMPVSDIRDLDAVVHALGIEDSDTTPTEAVAELQAEIEQLRARVRELEDAAEAADRAEREAMDHAQYQSTVSA